MTHDERTRSIEVDLTVTSTARTFPTGCSARRSRRGRRRTRERLEHARNALTEEHLLPLQLDAVGIEQAAVRELGAPNYVELHRRFGFQLDELAERARAFLQQTEPMFERAADRLFRERVGVGLAEAKRWTPAWLFRAPEWDTAFPETGCSPRSRRRLPTWASISTPRRTSSSTSRSVRRRRRAPSARRSRCRSASCS